MMRFIAKSPVHALIRGIENVRLAGIMLTLDSSNNPVSRADNVATLKRINPTMVVHDVVAEIARPAAIHIWPAKISHNSAFARFSRNLASVLKWSHHVIVRMVAILIPPRCLDDDWLFDELHCHTDTNGYHPTQAQSYNTCAPS
jgi:hypothetical protein